MPHSSSPLAYDDIRSALDQALEAPKGVRIICDSEKAAIRLRQRCQSFRKIDRAQNTKIYQEGDPMWGRSVYDRLSFSLDGEAVVARPTREGTLKVEPIP